MEELAREVQSHIPGSAGQPVGNLGKVGWAEVPLAAGPEDGSNFGRRGLEDDTGAIRLGGRNSLHDPVELLGEAVRRSVLKAAHVR